MATLVGRVDVADGRMAGLNDRIAGAADGIVTTAGRFSAMDDPMAYTREEVCEASGLSSRTIRRYITLGLLPPPKGYGLAATYDEAHFVRAVTIGRMRAGGKQIVDVMDAIAGWSTRQFARYVEKTNPAPAPPPADVPELAPADPVERPALPRGNSTAAIAPLPRAPAWSIYPLARGMVLMVDTNASPAVQRMAAEILSSYGEPPAD